MKILLLTAVSAGLAGWPEDVIQMGADLRAGRFIEEPPWVLEIGRASCRERV